MDVTPRELREGNIRDALRGYNHDDVDELLERAAATIEGLNTRVSELAERVSEIETEATRGRETEEMLQRTLLLAQRAADEALEEAREAAQKVLHEAEEQAATVVSEAERDAKREMEDESRRLQREVLELAATRELLDADATALTKFAGELGDRLREAVEAQLAALESRRIEIPERPVLSDVDLPRPVEGVVRPVEAGVVETDDAAMESPSSPGPETVRLDALEEVAVAEPTAPEETEAVEPAPSPPAPDEPAPVDAPSERHSPLLDERFGLGPARPIESRSKLFDSGEVMEGEVLDDETFFASLRDAVKDDRPLGPRDEEDALGPPETHGDIFDQEDEEDAEGRGFFRRKR